MSVSNRTFLGKNGKVFGPYTGTEIDQLRSKGELSQYIWIWDATKTRWNPIEAPPPAPEASQSLDANWDWNRSEVIGHDHDRLISGKLSQVTQTGCDLISQGGRATWARDQKIVLNVYDPVAKACRRFMTQVFEVVRMRDGWVYRLRWEKSPL